MRIVKRIIFAIGVVAALALVVAGVGYWRLKVDPEWYRPRAIDPEAARRAANRADQKFADALNWAAGAQAAETRRRLGSTLPSDLAQVKTLSFTEEELNAFFNKWSNTYGWARHHDAYVVDPMVSLQDGNIVFAGRLKDFPSVVSMHYEPVLGDDGQLKIRLVRVQGGRLPLPKGILDTPLNKLEEIVRTRLPDCQRGAKIDGNGTGNADAIKTASLKMLLDTLENRPADASLFLPIKDKLGLPVRITQVSIVDKTLSLGVRVMNDAESTAMMTLLREPIEEVAIVKE